MNAIGYWAMIGVVFCFLFLNSLATWILLRLMNKLSKKKVKDISYSTAFNIAVYYAGTIFLTLLFSIGVMIHFGLKGIIGGIVAIIIILSVIFLPTFVFYKKLRENYYFSMKTAVIFIIIHYFLYTVISYLLLYLVKGMKFMLDVFR